MSELLPSREASRIRASLVDYLTTTFALSDGEAQHALQEFLNDPEEGIFRGPYVRARVPFRPATEGWRDYLVWYEGHTPYGHQAEAFRRLSTANYGAQPDGTEKTAPLPTLVVTGTGSGKTEAFLYPILDHVLRAQAAGDTGVKALILYPMNALANDQARRIAEMITEHEALRGVRAAVYTGESQTGPTKVTGHQLISDRAAIRTNPPDILLTNYKMLDQLLLRGADQQLIDAMATSLQYLVLDEFHTYDGAQGTDVAMLIRRLGLAMKRNQWFGDDNHDAPLGRVTPVATSATLGDEGDTTSMREFAETVFGIPFDDDSVVRETRQSIRGWRAEALAHGTPNGGEPVGLNSHLVAAIADLPGETETSSAAEAATAVLTRLFADGGSVEWNALSDVDLLASIASHDFVYSLAHNASAAISIDDLADAMLPKGLGSAETYESRRDQRRIFLTRVLAALSHVRARIGRRALSIDVHLWIRELTRIDRAASSLPRFSWTDDGPGSGAADDDDAWFPAIFCRHCGRSGWGVELAPVGTELAASDEDIRRNHAAKDKRSRFRALIAASAEAEAHAKGDEIPGLTWFDPVQRDFLSAGSESDSAIAVLTLTGDDIDDDSREEVCPACGQRNGIRFLGSAMATMLSVVVTSLFGDAQLDRREKKALVFTDSVQDAAHRAGFIQSRAHVFALRNAIRQAVGNDAAPLDEIVPLLVQQAGNDADARYRLLPPDLVDRPQFAPFWQSETLRKVPPIVLTRVKRRLLFDLALEFGLQSRVGRTLELTGSLAASVSIPEPALLAVARKVLTDTPADGVLDIFAPAEATDAVVVRWARGVIEHMRDRGAIEHEWFNRYIADDGKRYSIWGGRKKGEGMPAFPNGREAPGYPRVGAVGAASAQNRRSNLDIVSSAQSWYAIWARKTVGAVPADGVRLTTALFAELERAGALRSKNVASGSATAYAIPPSSIVVAPVERGALERSETRLECDVCNNPLTGTADAMRQLRGGACFSARCPGTLQPAYVDPVNYYRSLYDDGSVRRVVAREHTSLLDTDTRLEYENGFKASSTNPAAPNVLVATPTLEMGIDIGDLSTVMLAGLPRTTASYLQRVGRAGRLTGNALSIAAVTGRGDQLPRIGDPLSVINGPVRPPATFVDAQEILRRQYFASVLDRRSDGDQQQRFAKDVLQSAEADSFLGDAIVFADQNHTEFVNDFLSTFPTLGESARHGLREWTAPRGSVGTSALAEDVRRAVRRWSSETDKIRRRRKEIDEAMPELEAADKRGVELDAKDALQAARSAIVLLRKQLRELTDEYWIGALERFGLLPNYTLIDDSVTLDAAVSWVDPDTSDWHSDTYSYERGSSIAIHEFAPGAHFYARGLQIEVDAIDLGPGGEGVEEWTFCPACGFAQRVDGGMVKACPRCGSTGIADTAQRMLVTELKSVSAFARRDEATISDRDDNRVRTPFTVKVAADVDPAGIVRRWFDTRSSLGTTYVRDLTIRWINVGKRTGTGANRMISGEELVAPLFRVCNTCGQIDKEAGGNDRYSHRPWCARRNDTKEHTRTLGLTRTLVTQGIFLRLPPAITLGDRTAVPSVSAAVRLGLSEELGGNPDHLRIESVPEPLGDGSGGTVDALLVHDTVPGGTGYLAELADPERLHAILEASWRVLRHCPCQYEQRTACHRCLLPFSHSTTSLSRASAEQALGTLLSVTDGEPAAAFDVTDADPGVDLSESVIEQLFRKIFIERAEALGGRVKEIPGDWGNKVQVSFPGDARIWMLRPQVPLGITTPDFVLEQFGGGSAPVAVYTDGKAFHAVVGKNRLGDDAGKRAAVRDMGYRVLAVTWHDLQDESLDEGWFSRSWAEKVVATYGLPLAQLEKLTMGPITTLMEWMQRPDDVAHRRDILARALPLILQSGSVQTELATISPLEAAARVLIEGLPATTPTARGWVTSAGGLVTAARLTDNNGNTEFAIVLDDSDEALSSSGFDDAWRMWLHLSNVVGWRQNQSGLEITTRSQVSTAAPASAPIALDPEWEALAAYASDDELTVISALSALGVAMPEMGVEATGGIPLSFAWMGPRVAIALDLQEGEADALAVDGWTLVDLEATDFADQITVLTGDR